MNKYLIIIALSTLAFPSLADEKPKVQLVFQINDPLYKIFFEGKRSALESSIQQQLCPVFENYLSFIDFSPSASDDKLIISLHNNFKNNEDFTTPKDLVFFFDFSGPHVKKDIPPLQWPFQKKSSYGEQPFNTQDFAASVVSIIGFNLKSNYEMMVESMFSKFILTNDAHMISGPQIKGWALPFSSSSLGIGTNTEFSIEVSSNTGFGDAVCDYFTRVIIPIIQSDAPVPPKFKGCFIVKTTSDKDDCSVFSTENTTTQVKEVTIKTFDRQVQVSEDVVPPANYSPDSN